jgi:hypothetical protein
LIRVTGFPIKNLMIADGGNAVVDHGASSPYVGWIFTIWRFARGG